MRLGAWMVMLISMILFLSFMGIQIAGLNPIPETFGININQSTGDLESADVEASGFWGTLFGETAFTILGIEFSKGILISLVGTIVVIIGLFAKGYDPSLVVIPLLVFIGGVFISTFWSIIKYVGEFHQSWMTNITAIIFTGLAIGFTMAIVDYFRTGN